MFDFNIKSSMIILAIIAVSVLILLIITLIKTRQKQKENKSVNKMLTRIITVSSAVVFIASSVALSFGFYKYKTALAHGMYDNDTTFSNMLHNIDHTPAEDTLPENLNGCIVIYYKFDCPDCSAIYSDLHRQLENKDNVYWISTRSKQGAELIKKYPVEEVPSGIYIRNDNYNDLVPFTAKRLYMEDENGNIILNQDALDRLLFLQSENR